MKKADRFLAIGILIAAVAIGGFFLLGRSAGSVAVISKDGREIARLPLSEDTTFLVEGDTYTNLVEIAGGEAFVTEANCPDHICIQTGHISRSGQAITCLPNRMVVEIVGGESTGIDGVAK